MRVSSFIPQFFVAMVVLSAVFLGIYKINENLFFYTDQAVDARRIARIWKDKQVVLEGTETSIGKDVRLGPAFYYMLAPFYLLGRGNPIFPAVFLIFVWAIAIIMIYRYAEKTFGSRSAWIVLILLVFSHYLTVFSRWLSNPNPMLFISILLIITMDKIMAKGKPIWWLLASFLVGFSFQLEAASGFFYVFVLVIFTIWQRKKGFNFKTASLMLGVFILTCVPLLIRDIQNEYSLSKRLAKYIFSETNFSLLEEAKNDRSRFIRNSFSLLFFPGESGFSLFWLVFFVSASILKGKELFRDNRSKLLLLFVLVPLAGIYIFKDHVESYYFAGFFVPIFLLISNLLSIFSRSKIEKAALIFFITSFLIINLRQTYFYLNKNLDDPQKVSFKNQKEAVDWVARGVQRTWVDFKIYVPDKQTNGLDYGTAYRYLLTNKGYEVITSETECRPRYVGKPSFRGDTFYVLKEYDSDFSRIQRWFDCYQMDQTTLIDSAVFGGITVEKRKI